MSKNITLFYIDPSIKENKTYDLNNDHHRYLSSNYFSILKRIAQSGHICRFIILHTMPEDIKFKIFNSNGVDIIYTNDINSIKDYLQNINISILRGNYKIWNQITQYLNNTIIFIPCWAGIKVSNIKFKIPKNNKFVVLLDDTTIKSLFEKHNIICDIFKKPAPHSFYKISKNIKDIDILFVCSNTDRPWKRVDLFLECLVELDKNINNKLNVALIGDSSFHKNKIKILNDNLSNILITTMKKCSKAHVKTYFDRSKISVCFSDRDANPRTISESMACNVPVMCASDLAGGKHQINDYNGILFEPTPVGFLTAFKQIYNSLNKYKARENCITLDDSVKQILYYE